MRYFLVVLLAGLYFAGPAFAQVTGSYTITTTSPNQSCFTWSSGSLTGVVSGACASGACSINIDFDFSQPCDIVAVEQELP